MNQAESQTVNLEEHLAQLELDEELQREINYERTLANLKVVTYRGIKCISTIPKELIFGISSTVLECVNCMVYATDPRTKILIGICTNCAMDYNELHNNIDKYGCGYYFNLQGKCSHETPFAFGNLATNDVITRLNIIADKSDYEQVANKSQDTYSIYNIAMLSDDDFNLFKKLVETNIIVSKQMQHYYCCEDEVITIGIMPAIKALRKKFTELYRVSNVDNLYNLHSLDLMFNADVYSDCLTVEKYFKVVIPSPESRANRSYRAANSDDATSESTASTASASAFASTSAVKFCCNYCNKYKYRYELKKCGQCKTVRYCSIACQSLDWKATHKHICMPYLEPVPLHQPTRDTREYEARQARRQAQQANPDESTSSFTEESE